MAFRSQAQPLRTEDPSKRSLALPPLVTEADEARLPPTLPPHRSPLPSSTSISSGTTVTGTSLQEGSGSYKQDVEVIDISDEGDESPTHERGTTASPAPKYHDPPASSISRSFASSSREVHSLPEEPQDVDVNEAPPPAVHLAN
jgi:hypothetical protein